MTWSGSPPSPEICRQIFHIRQTLLRGPPPDKSHAGHASGLGFCTGKNHFPFTFDDTFRLGSITPTECLLPDTPPRCCPPSVQQSLHTGFPATGPLPKDQTGGLLTGLFAHNPTPFQRGRLRWMWVVFCCVRTNRQSEPVRFRSPGGCVPRVQDAARESRW